ncbi:unnamed protein product [Caenorhabditis bovis]|uniref:Thymidine kinase n=1 Tax=Caenorhabditis bovis TaxID=2654633 RepID=A0A8S1F2W0_9PELO|nr:unnamed protein product [Caenorhabditis bovis]
MSCCSTNSSLSDFQNLPRCPNRVGSITMIIGPMFSGKTTELLRLHERQIIAKRNCVLVKYAGDTRYDPDLVATHTKRTGDAHTVKAHRLAEVYEDIFDKNVQVVSIDEGQFFDDLAETCEQLAKRGKVVCVAVLNGTFERKPFPQVSLLIPYANEIKQVTAICVECGAEAHFSFRSTMDKKIEVIGGADTYSALCRECYMLKSFEKDADEKRHEMASKDENENGGIMLKAMESDQSDGTSSPPRKKLILSKSAVPEAY